MNVIGIQAVERFGSRAGSLASSVATSLQNKRQSPCHEPYGPVHSGPLPDVSSCARFLNSLLAPSHTAGSYLRDCPYSPLLLEPSADRHQHGSRPHRLGAALNLLTVSFKTPLHCCLIPRSLPLLQTFLTDLSQATDLRTHLLSFLSSVMFVRGRLHPLPHTPMPLTGSYRGMAEPKN